MKFALYFLLLTIVSAYPRDSCLKVNSVCNTTLDFAVDDYILCGEQPKQDYPVDPNILAPKGSGYMRHPDDCDGICVDILSEADKDRLVCNDAILTNLTDCTRFKNAKHCVTDTEGLLYLILAGVVVLTLCGCCLAYDPNRKKGAYGGGQ